MRLYLGNKYMRAKKKPHEHAYKCLIMQRYDQSNIIGKDTLLNYIIFSISV